MANDVRRKRKLRLKSKPPKAIGHLARLEYKKHTDLLVMIARRLDDVTAYIIRLEQLRMDERCTKALEIMRKQNVASKMATKIYLRLIKEFIGELYERSTEYDISADNPQESTEPDEG